jgi:hypothetical protein
MIAENLRVGKAVVRDNNVVCRTAKAGCTIGSVDEQFGLVVRYDYIGSSAVKVGQSIAFALFEILETC